MVLSMLSSVFIPKTLINIQKIHIYKCSFTASYRDLCIHFGIMAPNNVKYTQFTLFFFNVSPYIVIFMCFSVLISKKLNNTDITRFSQCLFVSQYGVFCMHCNFFFLLYDMLKEIQNTYFW